MREYVGNGTWSGWLRDRGVFPRSEGHQPVKVPAASTPRVSCRVKGPVCSLAIAVRQQKSRASPRPPMRAAESVDAPLVPPAGDSVAGFRRCAGPAGAPRGHLPTLPPRAWGHGPGTCGGAPRAFPGGRPSQPCAPPGGVKVLCVVDARRAFWPTTQG